MSGSTTVSDGKETVVSAPLVEDQNYRQWQTKLLPVSIDVTLHYLQHEFCHVHNNNKKIDALSDVMLRRAYIGKDVFVGPLSEAVWSEYFANRRSSTSVTERIVCDTATRFKDAIARTEALVDPLA